MQAPIFACVTGPRMLFDLRHSCAPKRMQKSKRGKGRDTVCKNGTIQRFMEHLNPRSFLVAALNEPNDLEPGPCFFRCNIQHLPTSREVVLYDRSSHDLTGVERLMNFGAPLPAFGNFAGKDLCNLQDPDPKIVGSTSIVLTSYVHVSESSLHPRRPKS